ncbi:MAG: trypsin-like serine protease [bacterium]
MALLSAGEGPSWQRQSCGGSIISAEWILTAAHCVVPDPGASLATTDPDSLVILSGTAQLTEEDPSPGLQSKVRAIIAHPEYDNETEANDIALIRLETPLTLGPTQQAILLPAFANWPASGTEALISGWGNTNSSGPANYPTQLRKATVEVIGGPSSATCGDYEPGAYDPARMLCAGIPVSGGIDSCQGDSGGPLAVSVDGTYYLAGVVSWGRGCAQPGYPGLYARVTSYTSWIASTQAASLGSITVSLPGPLDPETGVCAYAYSPTLTESGPTAGVCGDVGSASVTIPNVLAGNYLVLVSSTGPYAVPSWWSASGRKSSRSSAGVVTVAAGSDRPLSTTLEIGGYIGIEVFPEERSAASYVCFVAFPVGSDEYVGSNCPPRINKRAYITRIPAGNYQIQMLDLDEFYTTVWYGGAGSSLKRSGAKTVTVPSGDFAGITMDIEKIGSPPGKVRSLQRSGFQGSGGVFETKVTWLAPSSNGGSPVTRYKVVFKRGKTTLDTITVKKPFVFLSGLRPSTTYTVTVSAINAIGTGAGSTLTVTTPRR